MTMTYTSPPPIRYTKSEEKRSIVDTGLQISSIVLTTLEDAARFAPVPYLQEAASLALGILNMVATTKGNREAFKAVANDACELVCVVVKAVRLAQERGSIDEESDLMRNVRQLVDTLISIDNFTRKESHRNVVSQFLRHQSDTEKIEDYRRRLRKSLDIFGLQSNISISDNLALIIKKQNELLASRYTEEKQQPHRDTTSHLPPPTRSPYQPIPTSSHPSVPNATQDPFGFGASFAHFHPGANVKYTAIGGNMTTTDSSNHISNMNSGNTTTTTIRDAYNSGPAYRVVNGRDRARRGYR